MSNSDLSSLLDAAMAFADFGSRMVIFGIGLEIIDLIVKCGENESFCNWFGHPDRFEERNLRRLKSFSKFFHHWTLAIEILSFALVVIGLSIEIKGSHDAFRISDRQNSILNKEAGDARQIAGEANERAAKIELNNLILKKEVLELEIKAGRRHLTDEQKAKIETLLNGVPRGKIWFDCMALGDDDTVHYMNELTAFLTKIGFDASCRGGELSEIPQFMGMAMGIKSLNNYPPFAAPIQKVFGDVLNSSNPLPPFVDSTLTNAIVIKLGIKPTY